MTPIVAAGPYRGQVVTFGTRHDKHHQCQQAFRDVLGAEVVAPSDLDTDQFGTFTGDPTRTLPPLAAARAKARLGMTATSAHLGLASEASYGPLPGAGVPGHEELLLFLDDHRRTEIVVGERRVLELPDPHRVTDLAAAEHYLAQVGFGDQGVVVRPATGTHHDDVVKGITDRAALAAALTHAAGRSTDGNALLEADLRAHHNPTRRAVLRLLAHRMATRLATPCPACATPGYGRTDTVRGLPCAACATPTDLALAEHHSCPSCTHHHHHPLAATTADPQWCPSCNP